MLEPDEGKLSSPVLRGLSGRKAARLPGEARLRPLVPAEPKISEHTLCPLSHISSHLRVRTLRISEPLRPSTPLARHLNNAQRFPTDMTFDVWSAYR